MTYSQARSTHLDYHVFNGIALSLLLLPISVRSAEIKVLSDGPLRPILPTLAANFQRDTGHHVDLAFAPAPVLADRVAGGEVADVLIVRPDEIDELEKAGEVIGQGQEIVSRIPTGLMVREDRPAPDISSTSAFKRALLAADTVIYLNLGSGVAFGKLLDRLGISATMSNRIIALQPDTVIKNPDVVFEWVANSKGNTIGAYPLSMILAAKGKGTKLVGPLPADYQSYLVLSAAMMARAPSPDAASHFIRFMVAPNSHAAFVAAGAD